MLKLILFGILKGIGILLLALLILLLLTVLVVLLSPIRYRLEGEKKTDACGSFGVSWLFGAIRMEGGYTPEAGSRLKLRVLWFTPIGGEEKPKKQKKKKKKQKKTQAEPIEIHAAEKQAEPKKDEPQKDKPKQTEPKKEEPPKKQVKPQRMAEKQPKTMRRVKLSEIAEKPPTAEPKIEETEDEAFFTGEETAEKTEKKEKIPPLLKELWSIEEKKKIFKAFGKLLKRLLKGILPGHFFLKATIGTGDPPTTGYLLGLAGILTAKFGNDIQIKADFTKATVEDIAIRVKGKIVLGRLLWAVLAFVLTKPVRRAIRKEIRYFRGKNDAENAKGETA